jgi:hypothetical protein
MRIAIYATLLLVATPVGAAEADLPAPPSPPAVTYSVWGFRWDGHQYVKQAKYSLNTPDLKQAQDYAAQITSHAGWLATTNMPEACVVHTVYHGPAIGSAPASGFPEKLDYAVWAFRKAYGKWVKDDQQSWTTTDPLKGLAYAEKVNAVSGWCATSNCPQPVAQSLRYVDGGTVHGAEQYNFCPFQICDAQYGPAVQSASPRSISISFGWNGNWIVQLNGIGITASQEDSYDSSSFAPAYDNSSDIQNSISTQDLINNQMMQNNIQDMINTQNMLNTQNLVNSMQDMVNTQNMVNAMNSNP